MKRPDNTEMDRLLRRHARLGGGAVRGTAAAAGGGAHMDADEMNAYAEGALPEAARSRYFAHLADCDACRKLVTELTLAATASAEGRERAAAAAAVTPAPSKSWRERLAALLSPQVLRYAVPALALFAVVIVAIVAMRANKDAAFVAHNEQAAPSSRAGGAASSNLAAQPTTKTEGSENHAPSSEGVDMVPDGQTRTRPDVAASPAPPPPVKAPADKDEVPAAQATPAPFTMDGTDDAKTQSRETDRPAGGRRAEEEVNAAPPPRPAQEPVLAAPAATGETRMRDEEAQRKPKVAEKTDGADVSEGTVTNRSESKRERGDLGKAAGTPSTSTRAATNVTRKRAPGGARAQTESAADTRSVSGRSFQRQGDAWVDTAYNPSRPTTNVRRGSEQYRTLVADEPGLRAITDQLGGEVIVVWKTRAYRFY
jgi:hypothetical protein